MDTPVTKKFLDRWTYQVDIGSQRTITFSTAPIAYADKNGSFREIDTTLQSVDGVYQNTKNALGSIIEPETLDYKVETDQGLALHFQWLGQFSSWGGKHHSISREIVEQQAENQIEIAGVEDNQTNIFETLPGKVKHTIKLDYIDIPADTKGHTIELKYLCQVNQPFNLETWTGVKNTSFVTPERFLVITDSDVVRFEKPIMWDERRLYFPVAYSVTDIAENSFVISYLININEIKNAKFPIYVDPTVSVSRTGSGTSSKPWEPLYPQTVSWQCNIHGHASTYETYCIYFRVHDGTGTRRVNEGVCGNNGRNRSGTFAVSSSQLGAGNVQIYVDGGSYSSGSGSVTFNTDTTAPTIDITSHTDNSNIGYVRTTSLTFTGTASDNDSGVSRVTGKCEGALNLAEFDVNTSSPTSWSYTRTFPQGKSRMSFRAQDRALNWSAWRYVEFTVDTVAPSVSFSPSSRGWGNTNISVTVTASDATSGVSKTEYAWSTSTSTPSSWTQFTNGSTLTQSGNGTWYLHVRATDGAGNVTTTYAGPYRKETTLPTISLSLQSRTTYANTPVNVTVTCSDSGGSGLSTTQYAWTTSTSTPSSWTNFTNGATLTQNATGEWYLHIRAQDGAGNVRTTYGGPYRIDVTVPDNPAVKVTGNTETSITLSWTVRDTGGSGVDRVVLYFQRSDASGNHVADIDINGDGKTEYSLDVGTATSYTINDLTPWTYYRYYIRVYDKAGNQRNDGYHVIRTVDTTNPTIDITSHIDNSNLGMITHNKLTFTGTASDNVLVKRVVGNCDGAWETDDFDVDTSSPTSWTYTHTFPEGYSKMKFRSQDDAGNWSPYRYVEFTVDTIAPAITFEPTSRSWDSADIAVKVTASDATTGIKTTRYSWSATTTPGSWATFTSGSTLTQKNDGTWYLHIEATDNAGNVFTTYKGPYRKDSIAPTHTSHSLTGQRYKSGNNYYVHPGDTVQITMVGADERSGLRRNYLRLNSSNGDDARAWWDFDSKSFEEYETATYVDIQGAVENSSTSTTFTVKIQSNARDGDVYEIRGWHWDRAGNWLSNFDTGMRLIVDAQAPTMTGWSVTGHRYYDGSVYWGRPGDQMKFRLSGRDTVSGPDHGYIQLKNKLTGKAEHASYRHGVGYIPDSRQDDHIDVTNAREISYNGTDMTIEFDFTLISASHRFDLCWYWYDATRHGRGYTDTGKDIGIDGTPPTVTVYPQSRDADPAIVWVNISAMDSESGLKSIEYKWSANENYTDNDMYPVEDGEVVPYDGNGTVYLHVRAEDNTGNITRVTYGPYTRISEPAGYAIVRTAREILPVPWFELSEKAYNALRIQITPTKMGCFGLVHPESPFASAIRIQTPRGVMALEIVPTGVFGFSSQLGVVETSLVSGFDYGKLMDIQPPDTFKFSNTDETTVNPSGGFDFGRWKT